MFEYGPTAVDPNGGAAATLRPAVSAPAQLVLALDIAKRSKALILGSALACALLGFVASKLMTPRYVATTQIYIDPGSLPGADRDALAPGQDSNGFINYVESQGLIITSRAVLERVVADEKLDRDPEFVGSSSFFSFLGSAQSASDKADAAAGALGAKIQVRRPERTFIIDLSVSDRGPARAAELANATARGYIEVISSMESEASRQTEAALAGRLEALRKRVVDAEKKVETYRADHGLVGTRELLVTEQQLKDMNEQITLARTKAAEARSRLDQIDNARKRGGDIAAIASQITSASLTAMRTQQAVARQRLADLEGELGPRHPQVIDAKARVNAADAAVDAELARFAQSQRIEYERASQLEASLSRQLEDLKNQSNTNGQSLVGLRDLERDADAARNVYDLFVKRSRESGEIQQVEPTRTKIVSLAVPPKYRVYPPSSLVMASAGLLFGLGLGMAGAMARERKIGLWPPDAPGGKDAQGAQEFENRGITALRPSAFTISARSQLDTAERTQPLDRLDLTRLGFPTLRAEADSAEFDAILDALGLGEVDGPNSRRSLAVAVVGSNDTGLRTSLAINLTLCAARRGVRVALIDAGGFNAKLTRAIRRAARAPILNQGFLYRTANGALLGLPKAFDAELGRVRPDELLRVIARMGDEAIQFVVCDGPDPSDAEAPRILSQIEKVVAFEETSGDQGDKSLNRALADAGVAARAAVRFDASTPRRQKVA